MKEGSIEKLLLFTSRKDADMTALVMGGNLKAQRDYSQKWNQRLSAPRLP
jgi:hypothetical protein